MARQNTNIELTPKSDMTMPNRNEFAFRSVRGTVLAIVCLCTLSSCGSTVEEAPSPKSTHANTTKSDFHDVDSLAGEKLVSRVPTKDESAGSTESADLAETTISSKSKKSSDSADSESLASSSNGSSRPRSKSRRARESRTTEAKEMIFRSIDSGRLRYIFAGDRAMTNNGVVSGLHLPPYKEVVFVNKDTKNFLKWNPSTERYPFERLVGHLDLKCRRIEKVGKGSVEGIECDIYHGFRTGKDPVVICYATKALSTPPSMLKANEFLLGWPAEFGHPLKIEVRSLPNRWKAIYEVERVDRKVIPESMFEVPEDFKEVPDVTTFALSGGQEFSKKDMEDLFEYHFDGK